MAASSYAVCMKRCKNRKTRRRVLMYRTRTRNLERRKCFGDAEFHSNRARFPKLTNSRTYSLIHMHAHNIELLQLILAHPFNHKLRRNSLARAGAHAFSVGAWTERGSFGNAGGASGRQN